MNKMFVVFLSVLLSPASGRTETQQLPQIVESVPEPTSFALAVADPDIVEVSSVLAGEFTSIDSTVRVSVIELMNSDGELQRGVEIMLVDARATDYVQLSPDEATDFQVELEYLEAARQFDEPCTARYACVHGIARCRPSQTVVQAYCPGRIIRPNRDEGILLSTPRSNFSFPEITIGELRVLVERSLTQAKKPAQHTSGQTSR